MFKRRELCDLNNPEERDLLIKVAGKALANGPDGPTVVEAIKVSDATQEGRNTIISLIERGFKVVSIKDEEAPKSHNDH